MWGQSNPSFLVETRMQRQRDPHQDDDMKHLCRRIQGRTRVGIPTLKLSPKSPSWPCMAQQVFWKFDHDFLVEILFHQQIPGKEFILMVGLACRVSISDVSLL